MLSLCDLCWVLHLSEHQHLYLYSVSNKISLLWSLCGFKVIRNVTGLAWWLEHSKYLSI